MAVQPVRGEFEEQIGELDFCPLATTVRNVVDICAEGPVGELSVTDVTRPPGRSTAAGRGTERLTGDVNGGVGASAQRSSAAPELTVSRLCPCPGMTRSAPSLRARFDLCWRSDHRDDGRVCLRPAARRIRLASLIGTLHDQSFPHRVAPSALIAGKCGDPGQAHGGNVSEVDAIGNRGKPQPTGTATRSAKVPGCPGARGAKVPATQRPTSDVVHVGANGGHPAHEVAPQQPSEIQPAHRSRRSDRESPRDRRLFTEAAITFDHDLVGRGQLAPSTSNGRGMKSDPVTPSTFIADPSHRRGRGIARIDRLNN